MDKLKMFAQTFLSLAQTATGFGLVIFATVHLLGVSMINFGSDWFDWYASHIVFVKFAVNFILFMLFFHAANGIRICLGYLCNISGVHKYILDTKYRGSYLWYIHFFCGILIAIFVFIHLVMNNFGSDMTTAELTKENLSNIWYMVSMISLLMVLFFHGLHGIKISLEKYGIWRQHQKRINLALLLIGIFFASLGASNLFLFIR